VFRHQAEIGIKPLLLINIHHQQAEIGRNTAMLNQSIPQEIEGCENDIKPSVETLTVIDVVIPLDVKKPD